MHARDGVKGMEVSGSAFLQALDHTVRHPINKLSAVRELLGRHTSVSLPRVNELTPSHYS